jgi:type IV fimbrial biogenesis protein FimT
MQNGLALARADAVRLNTRVAFVVSATGWTVQRTDDATVLHRATGKEATTGLTVTYTPADATTVTFDAFGRVVAPNPDGTASITNMALASATPSGLASYKPLQIQLTATGMSRLCDPYAGSTEPRACL